MADSTYRKNRTEAQSAARIEKAQTKRRVRRLRNLQNAGVLIGYFRTMPLVEIHAADKIVTPEEIVIKDRFPTPAVNPLTKYTVAELYELAKNKGLKVTTKTRKPELLELLGVN